MAFIFSAWAFVLLIVPYTLVFLAVATDIAPRRRYYLLGALALGTLLIALWGLGAFFQAAQGGDAMESAFLYLPGELALALALTWLAVAVAARARHWWWLGSILIVSVVPVVLILTSSVTPLSSLLGALGLPQDVLAAVFALPPVFPTLVVCAYAIAQSVRRPLAR
jgi:hypothetical protein